MRVFRFMAFTAALTALTLGAGAQDAGIVTVPSVYPVRETLDRLAMSVRAMGWVVFTEIDHAAAARAVGQALPARTVFVFGNPQMGTPAMAAHPTLALDLPLRVLVWEDAAGQSFITRSTGADSAMRIFGRHGISVSADAVRASEAVLDAIVRAAVQ